MTSLDLALVAGHTELRRLDLLGDPQGGVAVRGLRKLVTLRRLEALTIGDAHHTEFADLPGSDRLPVLKRLEIDGLREAAAAQIRARWAGFAGLALRGVRGDAWLAANADNPFRAWDEEYGAALGRRATNAWRKASGAIGARRPTRKRGERACSAPSKAPMFGGSPPTVSTWCGSRPICRESTGSLTLGSSCGRRRTPRLRTSCDRASCAR